MTPKPATTSGQFQNYINRHHDESRVRIFVPKEESFPIPLTYIAVTKATHTNLDVLQETRVTDYWNVDGDRTFSDPWKGFTKFTLLTEKPPKGYMRPGRDSQKFELLLDLIFCGLKCGQECQKSFRQEKEEWAI